MVRLSFLFLVVLLPTPAQADGFTDFFRRLFGFLNLGRFLDPLLGVAAQATCDAIGAATNVDDLINCDCDANFRLFADSTVAAKCDLDKPFCLIPGDLLCGDGGANVEYLYLKNDITTLEGCFDITAGVSLGIIVVAAETTESVYGTNYAMF